MEYMNDEIITPIQFPKFFGDLGIYSNYTTKDFIGEYQCLANLIKSISGIYYMGYVDSVLLKTTFSASLELYMFNLERYKYLKIALEGFFGERTELSTITIDDFHEWICKHFIGKNRLFVLKRTR